MYYFKTHLAYGSTRRLALFWPVNLAIFSYAVIIATHTSVLEPSNSFITLCVHTVYTHTHTHTHTCHAHTL
jgi:hypothetical protein